MRIIRAKGFKWATLNTRRRRILKSGMFLVGKVAGEDTRLVVTEQPGTLVVSRRLLGAVYREEKKVIVQIKIFMTTTTELSICKAKRMTTWKSIHLMSTTTMGLRLNTKITIIKTHIGNLVLK